MLGNSGAAPRETTATASALIILNGATGGISGGNLTLGLNSTTPTITTQDTNEALTIDPNGTGTIYFHGSTYQIDSNGVLTAAKFQDSADTSYFVDPAATGTSLFVAGDIVMTTAKTIRSSGGIAIELNGGTLTVGGGTGKVDAGTVDPPYTINGEKYATYLAAMTGQKEETTGSVTTTEEVPGVGYRTIINFLTQEKASDLWLFSQVTNLTKNLNQLVVLLSPAGNTRTWYTIDPATYTLNIYTNKPATVSYRLTAPRFDWEKWKNTRTEGSEGFVINSDTTQTPVALDTNGDILGSSVTAPSITKSLSDNGLPYQLMSATGEAIQNIESYSQATIANLSAGFVSAKDVVTDNMTIAGKSLADYILEVVKNNPVQSPTVISPIARVDSLQTSILSPVSPESPGIAVNLDDKQTFGIYSKEGTPAATFDVLGNATFSGALTAPQGHFDNATVKTLDTATASVSGSLTVGQDATIAGTLYADRIVTRFGEIGTLAAPVITNVTQIIFATPSASPTPFIPAPDTAPESAIDATSSALLALLAEDVAKLKQDANTLVSLPASESGSLTLSSDLSVIGHTALGETSIAGPVLVSGPLTLGSDGIQTLSDTLYIQKSKQSSVDILGGILTINPVGDVIITGNLAVSGNLAVQGILGVNTLAPVGSDSLTLTLPYAAESLSDATDSGQSEKLSHFGKFIITGKDSAPVASIDASGSARFAGNLVASGSGTFRKIEIAQNTLDANATESATPNPDATAGTGILPAGSTTITIPNTQLTNRSLIYITPITSTKNQVMYVKEKAEKVSFTVGLDTPITSDIIFNWWIIN